MTLDLDNKEDYKLMIEIVANRLWKERLALAIEGYTAEDVMIASLMTRTLSKLMRDGVVEC